MALEMAVQPSWHMAMTMGKTTMIVMRVDMGNSLSPHHLITLILVEWIGASL
jgi:hypothetical protein